MLITSLVLINLSIGAIFTNLSFLYPTRYTDPFVLSDSLNYTPEDIDKNHPNGPYIFSHSLKAYASSDKAILIKKIGISHSLHNL